MRRYRDRYYENELHRHAEIVEKFDNKELNRDLKKLGSSYKNQIRRLEKNLQRELQSLASEFHEDVIDKLVDEDEKEFVKGDKINHERLRYAINYSIGDFYDGEIDGFLYLHHWSGGYVDRPGYLSKHRNWNEFVSFDDVKREVIEKISRRNPS